MSLSNTALNAASTGTAFRKKYTVGLQDIKAGGAFTTVDIALDNLPIGAIVTANRIKHSASVAGAAGPITAATARLKFNGTSLGAGALDVYAAPGTTVGTHEITGTTAVVGLISAVTPLIMTVTQTGATTGLSDATAGSIDAYVEYVVLN